MSDNFENVIDPLNDIAGEVIEERLNQIERWGQQDHPSSYSAYDRRQAQKASERWHQINDARVRAGKLTWDGILLEEVWEALAEEDEHKRREELVQVAAVAAAEIEAIDRRLASGSATERQCPETGETCDLGCEAECLLAAEKE